ncbi:MAG: transcription elongation factor GreA [Spirochaetaceae bacterium]|nr:transcription elongation factor GreA [Spirochaetaceae bacterium]
MSETLLKDVQEILNEEKWTRATLGNYSTNQFKDLDIILKEARTDHVLDELKDMCEEHLVHTKNSIIALYLSGMIALSRQLIDDSALINLITIFVDNRKWNIVKYLCERILDYGESKFALRTLADCYKNDHDEKALYETWEQLARVDFEDADLTKMLAEYFEKMADLDKAIDYYKKALHRYLNKQSWTNVKEIWENLMDYCPQDIEFFLHVQKKIAKTMSQERAIILLQELYTSCRKRNDISTAIDVLKIMLQYEEHDMYARKEIVDCFRVSYAYHSQIEDYIRVSNLLQGWRNIHEAIADFEKRIAFDKGNFVYHRTWGVGRIAQVHGDEITIDFAKQRGHTMSLKMAVEALQILSKNHIWVLKALWKKEKLHDHVKADCAWALRTVILSFGESCDMKRIKSELVPSVLSAGEWTAWNSKAREILKSDPSFGVSTDNIELFTVREHPATIQEKLYNEFKAQRNFFDRLSTFRSYLTQKDSELDSEYFTEMFTYFLRHLKSSGQINEYVVASYLLIKDIAGNYPHLGSSLSLHFIDIFNSIEDISGLFLKLKDSKLREAFLHNVKVFVPDWVDVFIRLFPFVLSHELLIDATGEEYTEKLTILTRNCFENYREYKEAVVWLFKNVRSEQWYQAADISYEKQLITLIHILDLTYREIENRRETTENRKINKQVWNILFKEGILTAFIDESPEEAIERIYPLINDVKDLDPSDKLKLRSRIMNKYPNFKFIGDVERIIVSRGLMVTSAKYEEKQRHLVSIMEEEVPANSREIAFALSLGDLRENAEYKAAKEKQEMLNTMVAKLKDEIDRAQIFDPATVNTNRAAFGTIVALKNTKTGLREEYTILGPWESDPDNRIISYLSPFGGAILNKKSGEQFTFQETIYTVESISVATDY